MAFSEVTIRIVKGRDPQPKSGNADDSDIRVDLETPISSYQQCGELVGRFAEIVPCGIDFEFSSRSIEIAIAMNIGFEEQEALRDAIVTVFKVAPSAVRIQALGWA